MQVKLSRRGRLTLAAIFVGVPLLILTFCNLIPQWRKSTQVKEGVESCTPYLRERRIGWDEPCTEFMGYQAGRQRPVTVREKLIELQARYDGRGLRDGQGRSIDFFRAADISRPGTHDLHVVVEGQWRRGVVVLIID
jgi:hypothetical protein